MPPVIEEVPRDMELEEVLPEPAPRRGKESAPLFVKVSRYKELIDSINDMKTFNASLKQMFLVINEADNVRNDALKIMRATVNRLDKTLAEIDSELVRPEGIDLEKVSYSESEVRYIEKSLSQLQRQLAVLRKDIHDLKE
jgi:cob(I)alamin adenosyltransferase